MSTPFVGEIRMFGGNFAPSGWYFCDGRLLPISEYETLFNLIGTIYGGDGQSTFALPDLRGRVPVHMGQGPGLSAYTIGEQSGVENVTLTTQQLPIHTHGVQTNSARATGAYSAADGVLANTGGTPIYGLTGTTGAMHNATITASGGNQPHNNMAPYLCVNFIISVFGIFPTQT